MHKVIPFMALMNEDYFIFDIHISSPEAFCIVFKDNKSCIDVTESDKSPPRTISSIIIYEASYKRRLFVYAIFIQENKQRTLSLSFFMKCSSNGLSGPYSLSPQPETASSATSHSHLNGARLSHGIQ